jgi:hypothetical protein
MPMKPIVTKENKQFLGYNTNRKLHNTNQKIYIRNRKPYNINEKLYNTNENYTIQMNI